MNGDYSSDDSANHSGDDHPEYSSGKHPACFSGYHQNYSDDHHGYSDDHHGYSDDHRGYSDDHRGYSDDHHGYSDDHRGYSDDHHNYSDDHHDYSDDHRNYSDDLCKYSDKCFDHLDDYLNYSGDHHDDNCNYSEHLANCSRDDDPSKTRSYKCTATTRDNIYGEGQYLESSPSPSKGVKVLPTILEPKSQEEVAHPFELDAALVAPNIVSDARETNSQADTADLSLQSPSHKSGLISTSFMPRRRCKLIKTVSSIVSY